MALDFPASPTTGNTYSGPGGVVWVWDGQKWTSGTGTTVYAPVTSPVFLGDPRAPNPPAGDSDSSVPTTAWVQQTVAPAFNGTGRNLLHNPLFNVAQRGAGPWTTYGAYTADRWLIFVNLDTASFTRTALADADRTAIGDEAADVALQNVFTGNAGAASYTYLAQRIEGVRRLANKTVTISFWAKAATGTPKLGISVDQNFGTGGSPSAQVYGTGGTVTLTTTWTRYSRTTPLASVNGMTLGTNGDSYTQLNLWFSSGTTFASLSGTVGVQSGTVSIWGVQLEIGSVATPLEKPDPRYDLANCMRFYQVVTGTVRANATGNQAFANSVSWQPMRVGPTITLISNTSSSNTTSTQIVAATAGGGYFTTTSVGAGDAYVFAALFSLSADL